MRNLHKVIGTLVGLSGLLCGGVAHADMYVCDNTSRPIWFVAGFFGNGDGLYCQNDGNNIEWKGYWNIQANSCAQIWSGCYNTGDQPYLAYFAHDDEGRYWAGDGLDNGSEYGTLMKPYSAFDCCVPMFYSPSDQYNKCNIYPTGEIDTVGPRVLELYGNEQCLNSVTLNIND